MHDPQTGRFLRVDPLASDYVYNTPYAYAENKLGMGFDLEGLELALFNDAAQWLINKTIQNPTGSAATTLGAVAGVGNFAQGTVTGAVNLVTNPPNITPQGTAEAGVQLGLGVFNRINTIQNGSTVEKSAAITETVLDVASIVVGTKGALGVGGTGAAASKSTTLFRAASSAEVTDMGVNGIRNVSTGYETGKLFATSPADAAQFGKNNFALDGIPNTVVPVQVPNAVMKTTTTFTADGMKAVSIPVDQFKYVRPLPPLNISPKPTNPFGNFGW